MPALLSDLYAPFRSRVAAIDMASRDPAMAHWTTVTPSFAMVAGLRQLSLALAISVTESGRKVSDEAVNIHLSY